MPNTERAAGEGGIVPAKYWTRNIGRLVPSKKVQHSERRQTPYRREAKQNVVDALTHRGHFHTADNAGDFDTPKSSGSLTG